MKLAVLSVLVLGSAALRELPMIFPRGKSGSGQPAKVGPPSQTPRPFGGPDHYPKVWRSTMATRMAAQKATQERYAEQQAERAMAARVQRSQERYPGRQLGVVQGQRIIQEPSGQGSAGSAGSQTQDGIGDKP